jgi:hypothetical protein
MAEVAREKQRLVKSLAHYVGQAARDGVLTGKPVTVSRLQAIPGPRAGAVELMTGIAAGAVLRALSRNDCAMLRQFVPWQFTGSPQAFMSGRYVRIEAGWPVGMGTPTIRLGDVNERPTGDGRWVAGVNERGATVLPALSDATPHFLVAGTTGSGKSVALRCAAIQFSRDASNKMAFVDGKRGESLKLVERLPGVVGPCAVDGPQIRAALGWACREMVARYDSGHNDGRVIVFVDEFQELVSDAVIVGLLRKLVAQGRAAGVHVLMSTQHPTVDSFGDVSIRRNLTGKIALHVLDADASRVAVGGRNPRADYLLGQGDSYTIAPGNTHRTQLAYVDDADITDAEGGNGTGWIYDRWPDYDAENMGQELPGRGQFHFCGKELGVGVISAIECEGRDRFSARMQDAGFGRPGYSRQKRLRELGSDALAYIQSVGYSILKREPENGSMIPAVTVW